MAEPGSCLSLEAVAAFAEGRLDGPAREAAVAHFAACEGCREVLAGTLAVLAEVGEGAEGAGAPQGLATRGPGPLPAEGAGEAAATTPPKRAAPWLPWAAAAALLLVSAVVVQRFTAEPRPPSRAEWLAHQPPAAELVDHLWGGIVTRGGSAAAEIRRTSAEVGALWVDLDVALAAGDSARARAVAQRLATLLEGAGLLDAHAARLRELASAEDWPRLRAGLPEIEAAARQRLEPFYLDLGGFLEQTRVAAIAGGPPPSDGRARRYLSWVLAQDEEPLPDEVRLPLEELREGLAAGGATGAPAERALVELTL